MFGWSDFSIDFLAASPVILFLVLALLIGFAVFVYYKTNPPVPSYIRIILASLRIIAIVALVGALLEPIIGFSRDFERKKRVSVLIDRSRSMNRLESEKSRSARLDSLLSSSAFGELGNRTDMKAYYFAESLSESPDNLGVEKTAIGDAITELSQIELGQPADHWLLLTDGNSNAGKKPSEAASGLASPVFAIDLSQDAGSFDVSLEAVDYNPVVFSGQKTEVKITVAWSGADTGKISLPVRISDSRKVLQESRMTIEQEAGFSELTLSYTPEQPGQLHLSFGVPKQSNEETADNNGRTVAVKVLKSRLAILLVADRPDYEVGFLNRFLIGSDKYDVNLISTGSKAGNLEGQFTSRQTELNRYDLVILHDPDPAKFESRNDIIESYLSEKGGAIWVIMSQQFASRGPVEWFNRLLPFSQSAKRNVEYVDFTGEPSEGNLFHPAVRLADDRPGIREIWSELPPFKTLVRCDNIVSDASVLVHAVLPGTARPPILGYKRFGPGKLLASTATPFWTWGFIQRGLGEDDTNFNKFLEGAISWLTVPDDSEPLRIVPEKEVFTRGETVRFDGFAFDQGFRPIPGVSGQIRLVSDSNKQSYETDLIDKGEGKFLGEFDQLPPGRYTYSGRFEKGGAELKKKDGTIMIESFSLEEFDQSGDPATLAAIARQSGGRYFTYKQFDDAIRALDLASVHETVTGELSLWGKSWLLFIFIGALAAEWVLRKINHLL